MTPVKTVLGPRFAIAVGACAVTAVLGTAITYAVADTAPGPHTYYACAKGTTLKAESITVDATPR